MLVEACGFFFKETLALALHHAPLYGLLWHTQVKLGSVVSDSSAFFLLFFLRSFLDELFNFQIWSPRDARGTTHDVNNMVAGLLHSISPYCLATVI